LDNYVKLVSSVSLGPVFFVISLDQQVDYDNLMATATTFQL